MKEVIRIDKPQQTDEKPVVFTHYLDIDTGWEKIIYVPSECDKVVYLGECNRDGDVFAVYYKGGIIIFKGHLNSGRY